MRDKVVIITGASSGIGKALAYELAHQGAKVVLAARNIEELLHIEQDLRQQGAEVLSVRTDVTKELACKWTATRRKSPERKQNDDCREMCCNHRERNQKKKKRNYNDFCRR